MYDFMLKSTEKSHAKYTLNYFGKRISYSEFRNKIDLVANALARQGIKQGDVVSICILSIPENYYLFYAVNKLGAIANYVAVNDTVEEMRKKIISADSKVVFVVNITEKAMLEAIGSEEIPIVSVPIYESMPFPISAIVKNKIKGMSLRNGKLIRWSDFVGVNKINHASSQKVIVKTDDVALIEYTSGTTGESKGAVHNNLSANTIAFNYQNLGDMMGHEVDDRFLNCIPPFLAYGIFVGVHMPICLGMEVVLCPNPDPDEFVKKLIQFKPNHFAA